MIDGVFPTRVKLGLFEALEPCLIMKEHYISKKGVPTVGTVKFKAIGKEVQIFNNNGPHRCYFRMSQEQVKEFREWIDAIDK
jgi:hypothetical protein